MGEIDEFVIIYLLDQTLGLFLYVACVRARMCGRRLCGIKPVRCTAIRTPRGLIPSGT